MSTQTQAVSGRSAEKYEVGQRLICRNCGAEIEITSPCTCQEPHQVIRCCGQDMAPTTGQNVHLGDE